MQTRTLKATMHKMEKSSMTTDFRKRPVTVKIKCLTGLVQKLWHIKTMDCSKIFPSD